MQQTPVDGTPATGPSARHLSVKAALAIAAIGVLVAAGATIVVLQDDRATSLEVLLGAIALAGFGAAAYGLLQAVLALIDTAGERRRHDRDVSERRKGSRARQPPTG